MQQGCSNSSEDVIDDKSFWSPGIFYRTTKHPNREHIKEQMAKTTMHKHVSNQLERLK